MDQEKGVLRALCPTHLTSSRGSPVPPTRLLELFSRYRGALEVGGVMSLLGWALPHKAPPSGHKRPLATHMRGAVLAFPDQDRSHTCSVRDRPTQLCIDRKAGRHSPQGSGYVQYVPPSSRHAMGGKKIRKREAFYWFPNLLLLKAALSRLDVGPAYYEDPAFPSRAYLVLVLRSKKTDALRLTLDPNKQATAFEPLSEKALVKRASALDLEVLLLGEGLMPLDWLERGEVRVRGMGFFSWCANAHFRFPFTSRGSRGSYAAAFPGPFLLVLRPEAIASS
ncbi:hypothetical protein KIW84_071798 [Lathyrus oleraceus]|uniref:Uncharacterized protein n=1 Tax=Pisum sativum TaxID=3888 RepID=A0A9D4VJ89_PEA|nr:hypothetical protein KIW84_071798 [Pisum sativum]